jgi:large subunit ribosomal protein L24
MMARSMAKRSSQPRKIRARVRFGSIKVRKKSLSSTVSKDLKEKYSLDHVALRKGDTVKIMRGDFKGVEGKVAKTFARTGQINIEGVTREKLKGGTVQVKINASKVIVTSLNLDDKVRRNALEK